MNEKEPITPEPAISFTKDDLKYLNKIVFFIDGLYTLANGYGKDVDSEVFAALLDPIKDYASAFSDELDKRFGKERVN